MLARVFSAAVNDMIGFRICFWWIDMAACVSTACGQRTVLKNRSPSCWRTNKQQFVKQRTQLGTLPSGTPYWPGLNSKLAKASLPNS
jgi:hypothetical protein